MFFHPIDEQSHLQVFEERHAPELFALTSANRSYLAPWLPWVDQVRTVQDSLDFILRGRAQVEAGEGFQAGIWYQGRLVGTIGFHGLSRRNRSINIGYWLGKDDQGRGIMTRSCRVMIDVAFIQLGMHRVEIRCAPDNQKSRAIPMRLGFTEEGLVHDTAHGHDFGPLIVYGLLKSNWFTSTRGLIE